MHIPNGILDLKTASTAAALSIAGLAVAIRQTRLHLPQRRVPLMGMAAAFIFAAQMLNFPVAVGASGHLIGGVLCSVLLGPSAAVLVITAVLVVQCFVFADGGLLALGANVFNMAIVSSVGGYFIYCLVQRMLPGPRGRLVAVAVASWMSTVVAAVVCAGQLAWSGHVSWSIALPAMAGVHMLIGIGEAVITTLVVFTITQTHPEMLEAESGVGVNVVGSRPRRTWEIVAYGLVIALGLAFFVSPFASQLPDGLDKVIDTNGLAAHKDVHPVVPTPFYAYHWPGIRSAGVSTALAGAAGTLFVFGLGWVMARALLPEASLGRTEASSGALGTDLKAGQ